MVVSRPRPSFFDQFALGPESKRAYTRIAQPNHPNSIHLFEFWQDCEKGGGLVMGRDLPSRPVAAILRNLIVYEPILDGADFRIRHAGTSYASHYGYDVTGKLMSDLFDQETFRFNLSKAKEIIDSGKPEMFDANLSQFGIPRRHYEVVLLPIWGPGKASRWMLCGIFDFV